MYHTFKIKDAHIVASDEQTHSPGVWDTSDVMGKDWFNSIPGQTILDAGCRDGWWSLLFSQIGKETYAMDWDDLDRRREVVKLVDSNYEFHHETIYNAASLKTKFDTVWISDVVCHLLNPVLALSQLRQITGDYLYVGFDQCEVKGSVTGHYGAWTPASPVMGLGIRSYPGLHTPQSMERLLNIAGFTDIEMIGDYRVTMDQKPEHWDSELERVNNVMRAKPGSEFLPERDVIGWKYEGKGLQA